MLKNEVPLPEKYCVHSLIGNYDGCLECHIEGDFLLIWYDESSNTIALFRLGSHSELFK
jgi:mRNA interferase YafQ